MGTTAEKLTYLNTTKTLIKDNLNLGGANISNEPFRVYSSKLIDIYKDFLAHGTDTLWNNWNKVSGSGTSLTLNNTIKAKMEIGLKGNTSQNGDPTPDTPIPVNVVTGDNEVIVSNEDNTQSQTYPINLGSIELCKIGDYQDSIVKDNGKWYLNKQIGKVVLDGSEGWTQWGADTFFITRLSTIRTGLSNYYKYNANAKGTGQLSNGEFFMHDNTNNNVVIFRNTSTTTLADFKTWLSTHNTEVYYVLSTPTYTKITDTTLIEQLDNLEKAYSYDTQTNISQENNDKPFILDVVALGELESI